MSPFDGIPKTAGRSYGPCSKKYVWSHNRCFTKDASSDQPCLNAGADHVIYDVVVSTLWPRPY